MKTFDEKLSEETKLWHDLIDRCEAMVERVRFAEMARDNAIAMRDAVQDRHQQVTDSAARRIDHLVGLVREFADRGNTTVYDTESLLQEILGPGDDRIPR